ncbi:hypothetical protein [Anaerococcus tetradius]|uniref:Uncharacterized protein n=1 Tax=Anaerococcus tetradius TaxID=33036 RepID=A0A133KDB6_9FIRM|nr:hypothetical protein [Anaerococcus tetradius]KWZ77568.1 hypothetical protein HMPREF3200_01389 [Anaerococcus tetradius]
MDDRTKRKYIMETKEVPIKTNKSSLLIKCKSSEKTYTEEEVKELLRMVIEEKENESNL